MNPDSDNIATTASATPPATRLPRYIGIGLVVFCLFSAAGLLSYNQAEMGWAFLNPAGHEAAEAVPCSNYMGVPGLYVAGLLQALLGGGALYAVLLSAWVSAGMVAAPQISRTKQWITLGVMVLCACIFLDLQEWFLQEWKQELALKSAGGGIGYLLGSCVLAKLTGGVIAAVLAVLLHGTALVIFSRVRPQALACQAAKDGKALACGITAGCVALWRLIRRTPATRKPTAPTHPEEEEEPGDWKADYGAEPHPATTDYPQPGAAPLPQARPTYPAPQPQARPLSPAITAQQQAAATAMQQQPVIQTAPPPLRPYTPTPAPQPAPIPAARQEPPALRPTPAPAPAPAPEPEPEPVWQPRKLPDIDAPPLPMDEHVTATDSKIASRPVVQQPPTGRARRPQQQFSTGDNLLDLLRPIEETIERHYAPTPAAAPQAAAQVPVNPRVLNDMKRHLHQPVEDDEEEEEEEDPTGAQQVAPPRQVPARRPGSSLPLPAPRPAPTYKPTPPPTATPQPQAPPAAHAEESARRPATLPEDTRTHLEDYPLPPYDMLNFVPMADEDSEAAEAEMRETQQCIMDALATFKIKVEPGDITRGPSITRYEFYPPQGLHLKRITNLENNLKLAARAKSINILAPIPGKNTIGIELENATKAPVFLRELLQSEAFHSPKLRIPVALGKDVYGNPVIGDLAAMPHTLVAGTTGSGKSVCVNSMILSMLYKFRPDELRLILVDPKVVEMQPYKKLPHLACPVVTNAARVIGALRWAVNEMEHRYKLFSKIGVRNFEDFNNRPEDYEPEPDEDEIAEDLAPALPAGYDAADAIVRDIEDSQGIEDMEDEDPQGEFDFEQEERIPAKLPYIVIIIDELADLMMQVKEDLENNIARLTQKARAAGIHLVAATQTPRANVITGIIKANIPSRLAFKVASPLDSRVILDSNGAENLLGKGDFLFLPPGGITKMTRAQGAFVSDPEIASIVKFCAAHAKQNFVQGVTAEMNNADGSAATGGDNGGRLGGNGMSDEDAELYTRCVQLVITERKASTSLLQRRFSIGYGRAAKIMDMMEKRGVIAPASGNTSRPREVLIEAPQ